MNGPKSAPDPARPNLRRDRETRERVTLTLTPTARRELLGLANRAGLSCSAMVEQLIRRSADEERGR